MNNGSHRLSVLSSQVKGKALGYEGRLTSGYFNNITEEPEKKLSMRWLTWGDMGAGDIKFQKEIGTWMSSEAKKQLMARLSFVGKPFPWHKMAMVNLCEEI